MKRYGGHYQFPDVYSKLLLPDMPPSMSADTVEDEDLSCLN